jgi:hypothetical protein
MPLLASMNAVSCAAVDENAIQKRLESTVGQRFSQSRWNQPTAAKRVIREDGESIRVYEFLWENGCAYQVVVRKADDVITSWRFTSEADLCKQVIRRPLGS